MMEYPLPIENPLPFDKSGHIENLGFGIETLGKPARRKINRVDMLAIDTCFILMIYVAYML